jgi:hypothetical protein
MKEATEIIEIVFENMNIKNSERERNIYREH